MSLMTIVMMVLYLALVWGLLVIAAIHLARHEDQTSGALGRQNLDDLPEFTDVNP